MSLPAALGRCCFGAMAFGLGLLGCQYEYPLPATLCDRWCAASEREACGTLNPVDCVIACEEERESRQTATCDARFQELIDCLAALSDAEACARHYPQLSEGHLPCGAELDVYLNCPAL